MIPNRYVKYGNVQTPITPDPTKSILELANPVLFYMTDFFSFVLNQQLKDIWNYACQLAELPTLDGYVVKQVVPYNVLPIAQQNTWQYPLLSAYTIDGRTDFINTSTLQFLRNIEVVWLIPPMTSEQKEIILPLLDPIQANLELYIKDGCHSDYRNGALVWELMGAQDWGTVGWEMIEYPLKADGQSHLYFHGFRMSVMVHLQEGKALPNFSSFEGFDLDLQLNDPPDSEDHFVDVSLTV